MLRRYTGLNHLAQAARTVLQNKSQVNKMYQDLCKVDFVHIQVLSAFYPPWDVEMISAFRLGGNNNKWRWLLMADSQLMGSGSWQQLVFPVAVLQAGWSSLFQPTDIPTDYQYSTTTHLTRECTVLSPAHVYPQVE